MFGSTTSMRHRHALFALSSSPRFISVGQLARSRKGKIFHPEHSTERFVSIFNFSSERIRSTSAPCQPFGYPSERVPQIILTPNEEYLFKLLLDVVEEKKLGTTLRVAGGWVRDKLLGREPGIDSPFGENVKMDVDIALDNCVGKSFAEQVKRHLSCKGITSHTIGIISKNPQKSKHLETANMHIAGFSVDFVNLRTESYSSDSRIPNMAIGNPIEDAFRRDLTINSLFYNLHLRAVEDFTGRGLVDLRRGVISTPLPEMETLLDDPLRVLRSIRFASRFSFTMSPGLVDACMSPKVHAALAQKVSRERIGTEVNLMMQSRDPAGALRLIRKVGIAGIVFGQEAVSADGTEDMLEKAERGLRHAHEIVQRGLLSSPGSSWSASDRCTVLFASFLAPIVGLGTDRVDLSPRRVSSATHSILFEALKLPTWEVEQVHAIHVAACIFRPLALRQPGRCELGMAIRASGRLWQASLVVAAALDATESEALGWERTVTPYASLIRSAEELGLLGDRPVWLMKPLLDGHEVAKLLPKLPRGPAFKELLEDQVEWMIARPSCSRAQVEEYLRLKYGEYQ